MHSFIHKRHCQPTNQPTFWHGLIKMTQDTHKKTETTTATQRQRDDVVDKNEQQKFWATYCLIRSMLNPIFFVLSSRNKKKLHVSFHDVDFYLQVCIKIIQCLVKRFCRNKYRKIYINFNFS